MALGFNSNLFNTNTQTQARGAETAGSLASANSETAGSLASNVETAGTIAFVNSNNQIDSFQSSNPFAPQIDYSQFANIETAGSVADAGIETAGSLAFDAETAGSLAFSGAETAGSVASSDGGASFSSSDGGFVC